MEMECLSRRQMKGESMLSKIVLEREKELVKELRRNKKRLEKEPEGMLFHHRDRGTMRFYQYQNVKGKKKRHYLGVDEQELTKKLAMKLFLEKRNQDIEEMLEAIQAFRKVYFKKHREGRYLEKDRVDRLLEEREIGALLGRDDLMEWMSAPYDKLQKYPEHLIHMVKDDVAVRSKSEEIIMNVLDRYHIAYRYDCAIEINGHILHPDFILRDPKTGKFILWEHLGAMDKEEYRQNARWKLNQYMEAGYTPMLDLIITSETEKHPMDTYTAEAIVRMMFL